MRTSSIRAEPASSRSTTGSTAYSERCVVGSLEEVAERLRGYEHAGCDRIMLQHLLHTDLEPVRLLGRELAPALG